MIFFVIFSLLTLCIIPIVLSVEIADRKGFAPLRWILTFGWIGTIVVLCLPSARSAGITAQMSARRAATANMVGAWMCGISLGLLGAILVTISVFFSVRSLTRDRLQVHAAPAVHVSLVSTITTNGRVEPDLNHVRAYFDESEIGKLAIGQPIQIKWDAKQGHIWNGHIERIPVTVINLGTRSVGEVLVKIDDPDGKLLLDTNVTVTATVSSKPNALAVPREALHLEDGKPYVYKVVKGGLQRTFVTTGTINLTQVAILSGLEEGNLVATGTANGQPLQEGIPIKVVQ